jgi:putative ABC transport system ATP-binding protein
VLENVVLPAVIAGTKRRPAETRARDMLDLLGLSDKARQLPGVLSGGQRQRLAIARALANEPTMLLADEPTGALDTATGETVMRLMRAACKRGAATVLVTHEAQLASWADRVVFVRDGRIVDRSGPPAGPESLLEATP